MAYSTIDRKSLRKKKHDRLSRITLFIALLATSSLVKPRNIGVFADKSNQAVVDSVDEE